MLQIPERTTMSDHPITQPTNAAAPSTFEELAGSRRKWIDDILHPWCLRANQKQLRQAHMEWLDIAGRVDLNATLWTWAWERFPVLTHPELSGVNETFEVRVQLSNGDSYTGYPDSRQSQNGNLILLGRDATTNEAEEHGPFSIDDIAGVERL